MGKKEKYQPYKSTITIIFFMNLSTFFLLGYHAVKEGLNIVIGVTLIISALSNVLNLLCMIHYNSTHE